MQQQGGAKRRPKQGRERGMALLSALLSALAT
jgi:hypothetical protein